MEKGAVFPLFYLPNVEFFKNLQSFKDQTILVEKYEHYPKQTFRNRTSIAGPNGILNLSVPIKRESEKYIKEIYPKKAKKIYSPMTIDER